MLTRSGLEVDTYARYRIIDPLLFYQTVRNVRGAQQRLDAMIDSSVRRVLGGETLVAFCQARVAASSIRSKARLMFPQARSGLRSSMCVSAVLITLMRHRRISLTG